MRVTRRGLLDTWSNQVQSTRPLTPDPFKLPKIELPFSEQRVRFRDRQFYSWKLEVHINSFLASHSLLSLGKDSTLSGHERVYRLVLSSRQDWYTLDGGPFSQVHPTEKYTPHPSLPNPLLGHLWSVLDSLLAGQIFVEQLVGELSIHYILGYQTLFRAFCSIYITYSPDFPSWPPVYSSL